MCRKVITKFRVIGVRQHRCGRRRSLARAKGTNTKFRLVLKTMFVCGRSWTLLRGRCREKTRRLMLKRCRLFTNVTLMLKMIIFVKVCHRNTLCWRAITLARRDVKTTNSRWGRESRTMRRRPPLPNLSPHRCPIVSWSRLLKCRKITLRRPV